MQLREAQFTSSFRAIATKYPPIALFEDLTIDPAEWEILHDIESLTNPAQREEIGHISLVPLSKRKSGPGASIIMGAFTHPPISDNNRFNRVGQGAYYASLDQDTCLFEVAYHAEKLLNDFDAKPDQPQYRVYESSMDGLFLDLRDRPLSDAVYHPSDYTESLKLSDTLFDKQGDYGILYNSVRNPGGTCLVALSPTLVGNTAMPIEVASIQFNYDPAGRRITRWYNETNGSFVII